MKKKSTLSKRLKQKRLNYRKFLSGIDHVGTFHMCTKRQYSDKTYADLTIAYAHLSESSKKPTRSYLCDNCGFWHVTSMPLSKYEELYLHKS